MKIKLKNSKTLFKRFIINKKIKSKKTNCQHLLINKKKEFNKNYIKKNNYIKIKKK